MKRAVSILILMLMAVAFFVLISRNNPAFLPFPLSSPSGVTSGNSSGPIQISSGAIPDPPLTLPPGYVIRIFASGLDGPRVLKFSPGGTLLVSEPTANRVVALTDKNQRGVTSANKVVINGANHVHGLAFFGGKLFVAEVNRVVRYNWDEDNLAASFDKVLFQLPDNNDHNNRALTFDNTGRLYVSVGSTCNVCRENSAWSGTVIVSNSAGDIPQVFATGLRNAAFTAINPLSGELWGTEMGRDYLGDDLPPDEINIIRSEKNYGWPFCYGNKIHDTNFDSAITDPCANTTAPIFEIPAHSAPLGLTFINSTQLPPDWQNDLLVAYHGSWNRSVPTGYKVVRLQMEGNNILGASDFITGFINNGQVSARPVDLTFDKLGNLYISDDKAGNIYIVQKTR